VDKSLIQAAINKHGAKHVRDAAHARMSGDKGAALLTVGLIANNLAEAVTIADVAYDNLSAAGQAIDYAQATAALKRFDKQ
jgi:hypothetical protein